MIKDIDPVALREARYRSYQAVGLTAIDGATVRCDRSVAGFLAVLAERGYRLAPPGTANNIDVVREIAAGTHFVAGDSDESQHWPDCPGCAILRALGDVPPNDRPAPAGTRVRIDPMGDVWYPHADDDMRWGIYDGRRKTPPTWRTPEWIEQHYGPTREAIVLGAPLVGDAR